MNLKTSFFNKSVIRSDLKRLWWVSATSLLTIFVSFTFLFLNSAKQDWFASSNAKLFINSALYRYSTASFFFACTIPVALAVLLFSYLNSSKAVSCMHSLPIKRGTFFSSHILSGAILLTIPVILNIIIFAIFKADASIAKAFRFSHLLTWAGLYLLYSFLSFSVALIAVMLTGNNVAAIAFTYVFALLPMCMEYFIDFFLEKQIYGYSENTAKYMSDFLYVFPSQMCTHPMNILKYAILICVFVAAAYLLYKNRNLENHSEIVAYPKLKPIFVYGVAVCFGAVGYMYINGMWNTRSIFALIPFGIVGIIGANMLVKKTVKIKGSVKPSLIFCAAIFILNSLFAFDFTGYERHIPKTDDIASAIFNNYVNMNTYSYRINGKEVEYTTELSAFTDSTDIENVKALHERCISDRRSYDERNNSFRFEIVYTLKNGKQITRSYWGNYDSDKDVLKPIIESMQIRENYFPILADDGRTLEYIDVGYNNGIQIMSFADKETLDKFKEALCYDTAHTSYDNFADRSNMAYEISIGFKIPSYYTDGTPVAQNDLPVHSERYFVRNDYEKTKALLQSFGIDISKNISDINSDTYETASITSN